MGTNRPVYVDSFTTIVDAPNDFWLKQLAGLSKAFELWYWGNTPRLGELSLVKCERADVRQSDARHSFANFGKRGLIRA